MRQSLQLRARPSLCHPTLLAPASLHPCRHIPSTPSLHPCIPTSLHPRIPAGTSQAQGSEGAQLLHQPHLHPCSLSMLLQEDWSPQHHLGEPQEDAPHPHTTSNQTSQPGPWGCAPSAGLRQRLPFGKAKQLLKIKQHFAEEEEAAAGRAKARGEQGVMLQGLGNKY